MKNKELRKTLAMLLILTMCLGMLPGAWADEPDLEEAFYEEPAPEQTNKSV